MKIRKNDKVLVIAGKDKGKTGSVVQAIPALNQVVVEGINVFKKHTKPSNSKPQGGILDITKPIASSKVMVIDPESGKPSRIGSKLTKDGKKERVFKASKYAVKKKKESAPKAEKPKPEAKSSDSKAKKA